MNGLQEASLQTRLKVALVRICRECGVDIEMLRAEQMLHQAMLAWPGDENELWSKWLVECCENLSLRARCLELSVEQVAQLALDGAKLAGGYSAAAGILVVVNGEASGLYLAEGPLEETRYVARTELQDFANDRGQSNRSLLWVVVEHPELTDIGSTTEPHVSPIKRLLMIIRPEWSDIWLILVFAFFAGVLNLATPIAVEALVNTVTFGQLLQPLIVLAIFLFGFLAFAAVMKALQAYLAEIIQQRLFVRVAADLAYRLPRVEASALNVSYGPELVNRFLDVVTLQKVVAILLLDGVSIILATFIGLVVLAFYHPWLLGFDVLLVLVIGVGLFLLGKGAIASGIDESKMKFKLTAWFQDVMRCQLSFKTKGGTAFVADRSNQLTTQYLNRRQSHFRILFRQILYTLALQAVAGTALLGVGGWLVMQGQLSLGQLVAAELIVTAILSSIAKLGKHLEGFYDLVAAVDKLGYLFDLPSERHSGVIENLRTGEGLPVRFVDLRSHGGRWFSAHALSGDIAPGERVAILGPAASGKTMLTRILYGLDEPTSGRVEIKGCEPRALRPDVLRSSVAVVGEVEIFEDTISENVHLGRPSITARAVRSALQKAGLLEDLLRLPDGIETKLLPSGFPLSSSQQRLLMIARAIAGTPDLIVIDGILDCLPDELLDRTLNLLLAPETTWTLIVTTTRPMIANRLDRQFSFELKQAVA